MKIELLIIQGLIVGFSLAAPVGPMAMLCIQRTLLGGLSLGLLSGLGIAVADAVYGLTAAFGLTMVSDFLIAYKTWLGLGGGLFLLYLGIQTIRSCKQVNQVQSVQTTGYLSAFGSAFLLTLTNPMTILAYVAIFSSAAISIDGAHSAAFIMMGAILIGSLGWWVFLCGLVAVTKHKLNSQHMRIISLMSGSILIGFGVYVMISAYA
ncbi:MAG: LysE family transporter [Myxococcaceae bacterium]